jgi:hypothetical protein
LGQTVILWVTALNQSEEEQRVWVDELDSEIQVFLTGSDTAPRRFTIGWTRVVGKISPSTVSLAPQEAKHYALRVLHTFNPPTSGEHASALAFPAAGEYEIYVKYPLYPNRQMLESNTIRIDVNEPDAPDARIWKHLNDEKTLYFLQRGELWTGSEHVPVKIAELIRGTADSAYHASMRWALGKYYYRLRTTTRNMYLPNAEDIEHGRLFRRALGIELQHPSSEWERIVRDRRLYTRRVVSAFPQDTPLDEVIAVATRQTGVPLRIDPTAGPKRRRASLYSDESLAEFMRSFTVGQRFTWVTDGRGYRIVPVPKPAGGRDIAPPSDWRLR